MKKYDGIISFDLIGSPRESVDVSRFFPISEIHAIRSTKPVLDTLKRGSLHPIDLSIPPIFSIPRYTSPWTLDIADSSLARERRLQNSYGSTIDLFPPLTIPYGALDTRGDVIISQKRYGDIYKRSLPWSLHARRISRESMRYLRKRRRPLLLTLALTVGLTIPILFYTKSLVDNAYGDILSLRDVENREDIERIIHGARGNFERANLLFMPFRLLPGESTRFARSAIDGGLSLTRGLDRVIADLPPMATGSVMTPDISLLDSRYRPLAQDFAPLRALGIEEPTLWMASHTETIEYLAQSLRDAGVSYSEAESISHPRASEVAHIGRGLLKVSALLDKYLQNESNILALLGSAKPERYIVFNQNRDEIRTNGGFPGSVITFTMFHGNIEDYRTDDVYYYDWNLYPFKELPPPGLALLSGNYGLRDVNYYPDFADTLEKANTFIERSGDPTVTVGVALHQGLIEDILADIGPVTLSGVTETFRSENFSLLMSTLVESRYREDTSAKDILREFVDAFAKKIHEKRAYEEVIGHIERSVVSGEILFASRDAGIEEFFSTFRKPLPWEGREDIPADMTQSVSSLSGMTDGETRPNVSGENRAGREKRSENWIYPTLTSLSGNKSDRYIERTYTAETTSLGQCRAMNKITFNHKHTYTDSIEKQVRSYLAMIGIRDVPRIEKMLAIQGKGKNIAYMRIFAQKSATLTGSTAGITTLSTPEGQEFSFSLDTPVGSVASKVLRYTVDAPGCTRDIGPAVWYRQPGLQNTKMMSR